MSTATPTVLMTGEEFVRLDGHELMSLVDGAPLVEETERSLWHGQVCATVGCELMNFVKTNSLGTVCGNNTSIRLKRNPDTVLGPDVCYFSAGRLSREAQSAPVCDVVPDLVVEVAMPTNPWSRMVSKARQYLIAGVKVVLLIDLETNTVAVHRNDVTYIDEGDIVTLSDVLPGFAVPLKRFFE